MKPGIPWSVKGIEQQARDAAKEAARQSGMTIGEWLNTVILESADGNDELERRYRRAPYRPKPLPSAEHGEGEEVTLRLEEIAEQLHSLARHESETALSHQASPADEARMQAVLERLEAYQQQTSSAISDMQERMEEVSRRLGHAGAERADDVPGYRALESALRNVIEHIEISETRTRDSIRSLQDRLTGQPAAEAAVANDMAEVRQAEERLRSLVEEAKQAAGHLDPESGLSQLRQQVEQLAARIASGSGYSTTDLDGRLEQLEAEFRRQINERDQGTQFEVAALGQRIAATEKRLDHLATIEKSVAQLVGSLEGGRAEARAGGASPELRALEEGLKAVRASAEISDRRTQETLRAVHETLEQIVGKIAELEAQDEADAADDSTLETALERREEQAPAIDVGHRSFQTEEEVEPEARFEAPETETETEIGSSPDEQESRASLAEGFVFPEEMPSEEPAPEETRAQPADESQVASFEALEAEAQAEAEPETLAPVEPSNPPVHEDYIAAARRAAQMAAARSSNPVANGFNKFSRRMSAGSATESEGAKKRGFVSSLLAGLRGRKAKPGDEDQPDSNKAKRKRLLFAGLILLVAASAYGVQRHAGTPGFDVLGGSIPGRGDLAASEPGFPTAIHPAEGFTTASFSAPHWSDARLVSTGGALIPAEIGPQSLRQAAAAGDAIAQFVVAGRYLEGKLVARSEEQAAQWYAMAARQGLAAAQYSLGSMYEHGRGVPLDRGEAMAWYARAAEHGNVNAMHNLAVLLTESGNGARNYELAAKWFEKAAERGLPDSQFNLAVLNERGLGMAKNAEAAVFWYSLAAVRGDREAGAKAKALEASLAPEAAKQVRAKLLAWRPLQPDRKANVVPLADTSWMETS
jgi:localization factor PodJL